MGTNVTSLCSYRAQVAAQANTPRPVHRLADLFRPLPAQTEAALTATAPIGTAGVQAAPTAPAQRAIDPLTQIGRALDIVA